MRIGNTNRDFRDAYESVLEEADAQEVALDLGGGECLESSRGVCS